MIILLRDHTGYLHLNKTLHSCSSSVASSFGVKQTALGLCMRVLITQCLAAFCGGCSNSGIDQYWWPFYTLVWAGFSYVLA